MARLERLEKRYREHHRAARTTFVFARPERTVLVRRFVGDVVGLDVDREALAEAAKLGDRHALGRRGGAIAVRRRDLRRRRRRRGARAPARSGAALGRGAARPAPRRDARRLGPELVPAQEPAALPRRAAEDDPTLLHLFAPRDVHALLDGWTDVELHLVASRFIRLQPRLFANVSVFAVRNRAR